MAKTLVEYILPEDYDRYNQLLDMAEELKAKAPKQERAPKGPMTTEQKIEAQKKKLAKAQAALEALLAAESGASAEA